MLGTRNDGMLLVGSDFCQEGKGKAVEVSEFDYELPEELIAQEPVRPRDSSRLLLVDSEKRCWRDGTFPELLSCLQQGDCLVLNDTRVIPARLRGRKEGTGGSVEVVLLNRIGDREWEALVRPGRRLPPGTRVLFAEPDGDAHPSGSDTLRAEIVERTDFGGRVLRFEYSGDFMVLLQRIGEMPVPPYIDKVPEDPETYQTIYAQKEGSAAAPTAGFHFTERIFGELDRLGIDVVRITLHVGLGTFRPVTTQCVEEHDMHAEFYQVSRQAAERVNAALRSGGRVVAVGTTVTRTLETVVDREGRVHPGQGWTDLFIYPGYEFKAVDTLLTNFHLPRSTLLMLVCAFAGRELILQAYRHAVSERYRFYSFGDAMLIGDGLL